MEVDATESGNSGGGSMPVNFWCFLGKGDEGTKRLKADLNLQEIADLQTFKEFVCKTVGSISPDNIDLLYNGGRLKDDATFKAAEFKPHNVITVIKSIDRKTETSIDIATATKSATSQVHQLAIALKTAFYNPAFIPTIEKLGQSDKLENILAIAHGLKDDPVGIAIIQDPAMIFHLSDIESLKKLATERPWVIEAFNFLTGSVHQERGHASGGRSNQPLYNPLFDGDDDMDDDEEGAAGAANMITREQLSAALNSLNALGRGGLAGAFPTPPPTLQSQQRQNAGSGAFMDFLSQASGMAPPSSNNSAPATQGAPPNVTPGDLSRLLAAMPGASAGGQSLTPEMVARAMTTALNTLPPDARETRFNELRDQINRIQHMGNSTATAGAPQNTAPTVTAPPVTPAATAQPPATGGQYQSQLRQMRDLGITDERLSIMALRVSDGDVGTAVDLIFSGWTGEGAEDAHMSDEE